MAGWLYSKKKPVNICFTQDECIYDNGDYGAYLDVSSSSTYVASKEFVLPKGMYRISVEYDYSGPAVLSVSYKDGRYDSNTSGDIPATIKKRSVCDFKVNYSNRPMQVRGRLRGDASESSYLLIENINITDSPVAARNFVFKIFIFLCFVNLIGFLILYRKKISIKEDDNRIFRTLMVLTFIVSIPLMVDYLPSGHDLEFHLMRIEGLKAGLLNRTFPVKIQPDWLNGHGYAASVFYGDIFLYFPAILRIFGISVQNSYKLYVLLVNITTVFISYYCFTKMSTKKVGVICAALYSLNIYRLTCLYTRAALGEYTAMIFLPVVLYGFWKVYTLSEENKEHKQSWITIALGYTGIILSHMISCEIVALFSVLSCLILWKSTFTKKNFWILVKAAGTIVLLNIWFIIPVLDYLTSAVFVINNPSGYTPYKLDERAAFPAQLFMNTYGVVEQSKGYSIGTQNEMPMTLGVSFLLMFATWFILGMRKGINKGSDQKATGLCVLLGIISLLLTTNLFPYTDLAQRIPLLQFPERSLQYPWRFLGVAALFFTWLTSLFLKNRTVDLKMRHVIAGIITVVAVWQGISFMSAVLNEKSPYRVYQTGNFSTFEVMGGEYLPLDSNIDDYVDELVYDTAKIEVISWSRHNNSIKVKLKNKTDEIQNIEVPLLYYKGYEAKTEIGKQLSIRTGVSGRVCVEIPDKLEGCIKIQFKEPWYWRFSEMISLLSYIGLLSTSIYTWKRLRRK